MKVAKLLLLLIGLSFSVKGQGNNSNDYQDSLLQVLEGNISAHDRANTLVLLGKHHRATDTELGTKYLDMAIVLADSINEPRIKADAHYQKGILNKYTGYPELRYPNFSEAARIYLQLEDTLWFCRATYEKGKYFIHVNMQLDSAVYLLEMAYRLVDKEELLDVSLYQASLAEAYSFKNHYYKSINAYQKSIDALKLRGDTINWANSLQWLGEIYYEMGEYDKMIEMVDQSSLLMENIEQDEWIKSFIQRNYLNKAIALIEKGEIEEATPIIFITDSLVKITGSTDPNTDNLLADYYRRNGMMDSARFRFERSIKKAKEIGDLKKIPIMINGFADLLVELKEYDEALKLLKESEAIASETGQPVSRREALQLMAKSFAALGKYELAYRYITEHDLLADSLLSEDKIREITSLENRYAFEEEKKVLEQQQRERELLLQADIQEKQFIQYGLFAGLGIVAFVALLFYRFYQSKKKDNEKISQQSEELKKKHEEMTELTNYKQGLTHMIAHDMKNPLNVIIAMTHRQMDEEKWQEVGQSGQLMLQMVNNMLDIQRFEETQMNLKLEAHLLSDLATRAKYQVELLMMAKSIRFNNQIDEDLTVEADADIILRIFVNLYTNAIKYMPVGGMIMLESTAIDDRIQVSVSDTGQGIEEDLQAHVFDKFWQSDPKKIGMSTSNGLGLTFCKLAVMAHGGSIGVQSEFGEGSTFTFDLKKSASQVQSTQQVAVTFTDESNLTAEEVELIQGMSDKLRVIPIYKSTKIEEVLKTGGEDSPGIKQWKKKVREASFSFDNEAFEQLIKN